MTPGAMALPAGPGLEGMALAAAATVLALAKGFDKKSTAGKGWKARDKERRSKLAPCLVCKGTGKKPCQFCRGTSMMKGFLGDRGDPVPCMDDFSLSCIPCVQLTDAVCLVKGKVRSA